MIDYLKENKRKCNCNQFSETYQPNECHYCWMFWHDKETFLAEGGNELKWAQIQTLNQIKAKREAAPKPKKECGCKGNK